jgi:hypothetical protein
MRTQSACSAKRNKGPQQREPRPGTKLREVWDILHLYRAEPLILAHIKNVHVRIWSLQNFYGLDVRPMGHVPTTGRRGGHAQRYMLVARSTATTW